MESYKSVHRIVSLGLMLLGMMCTSQLYSKGANVEHSLPGDADFNISLMDPPAHAIGGNIERVVLDAGHGGKDPGCSGRNSKEKDIALDITLRLGQMIKRQYPDVKVIYTRDHDAFVPLHERANIANRSKADLFISIHCNTTAKRSGAVGTETFVMGLHRASDNLEVAKRENSVILNEQDYKQHYDGYDPNSDEAHIALSMYQNAFLDQSITFATMIEDQFQSHGKRTSRGVKQAGFLVLRNTVMPSVLVEAGFLNHNKEENFLLSEKGKTKIAESIFKAFGTYKMEVEQSVALQTETNVEAIPADKSKAINTQPSSSTSVAKTEHKAEQAPINYVERAKREMARIKKQRQSTGQQAPAEHAAVTTSGSVSASKTSPAKQPVPQATKEPRQSSEVTYSDDQPTRTAPREKRLEYVVQLSASRNKLMSGNGKWDQVVDNVLIRYEDNLYKYQVGTLETYEEALAQKSKLKELGFKDCFIVAYYGDQPIAVKEAFALANR